MEADKVSLQLLVFRVGKNCVLIEIKCKQVFFPFFPQGNFDKAVTILKPLRYKVDLVGSSRAQVKITNLSLLSA